MALESPVNTIYDLVATNPTGGDPKNLGDDHIRNIKTALLASLAGVAANPGYQKIGKAVIQWGTGTTDVNGNSTLVFPIAFPTACAAIVPILSTSAGPVAIITGSDGGTTTTGIVRACNASGTGVAVGYRWVAIGF